MANLQQEPLAKQLAAAKPSQAKLSVNNKLWQAVRLDRLAGQRDKETGRQAGRQTGRQTDRQTTRQT